MASPIGAEGGEVDAPTEQAIASARSGGKPLDAPLRRAMESSIGADFGRIRLHVGSQSDALNERIQAKAFTSGPDVFVRRQDYSPGTEAGQRLLAHELTHTVQQGAAPALDDSVETDVAQTLQRMPLTNVVQRDGDEDDEEDEVELVALSAITGDNGHEKLEEKFDEAVEAAEEAVKKLAGLSVSTSSLIAAAKKDRAAAQALVDEVDRIVELADLKSRQADKVADDVDEVLDDDELDLAFEVQEGFETLLRKGKIAQFKLNEAIVEASGKIGLAEDALNQNAAQAQKLAGLRGRWGSAALARGHFTKHKGDTGAKDEEEYLTRAAALNDKDAGGTIKRKTRGDGDILTMDTSTKEFTILSTKGKIRTFFCPGDGIRYFNRQK